jgi:nitrogen fixation protein NifU and related proteins
MSEFSPQIVEHFTNPRNCGELENPDAVAIIRNAACGDQLHLFARVSEGRIAECRFLAYGCAASLAMGSLLSEAVRGLAVTELATFDVSRLVDLAGGLSPSQMHCAAIGRDAVASLVANYLAGGPAVAAVPASCCSPAS